jgi:hypothetical protein
LKGSYRNKAIRAFFFFANNTNQVHGLFVLYKWNHFLKEHFGGSQVILRRMCIFRSPTTFEKIEFFVWFMKEASFPSNMQGTEDTISVPFPFLIAAAGKSFEAAEKPLCDRKCFHFFIST